MPDIIETYKLARHKLPEKTKAWRMYGAGLDNFGRDDHAEELPLPSYGPDELLVRVDACGICFSDVKLISLGPDHPRVQGRDLIADPVIPGHEVSLTIVGVGENVKDRFQIGQRYIVQADVYFNGVNIAYGYALPGGMSQYGVIGHEMIEGDEGCYLLPVRDETGYLQAALAEPWACVVASYRIEPRRSILSGGNCLIIETDEGRSQTYTISDWSPDCFPKKIVLSQSESGIRDLAAHAVAAGTELVDARNINAENVLALAQERTGGKGFDDIIFLGTPEPELLEAAAAQLAKNGIMNILGRKPLARKVRIDVGKVHYDNHLYIGGPGTDISAPYKAGRPNSELMAGGTAWFIGAAGPMGQMHVQRAVEMKGAPGKMLCTDVDDSRMAALEDRVAAIAKERGIEMVFLNPTTVGPEATAKAISDLTAGKGFDDVVTLVPVPALIAQAADNVADGGLLNIFAGVARGTIAEMDLNATFLRGVRFVGSSGSRVSDLLDTLSASEAGELKTQNSAAAIGGMQAMKEGIEAVKTGRFPGKTVIYPQIDLPLTSIADLKESLPGVFAKVKDGKFWTREAEEELLREKLDL